MMDRERSAIFFTIVMVFGVAVLQPAMHGRLKLVSLFTSLGVFILYLTLESRDYQKILSTQNQLMQAREDAAAGELLQSITNKMAIQARQLFGGMPGALSDRDMQILLSTQPSLSNTREGNMMIIDMQRKLYKRQKDIANLAREYQKKHGYVDMDGFTAVVKDFANKNSLFEQKNSNDPGDIIWPD